MNSIWVSYIKIEKEKHYGKKFEQIINEGKRTGKTTTEINAELKAAGANFHLDFEGAVSGWSEKEMEEGFIPAKEEPKNTSRRLTG